ncbi:hypothetical protein PDJAM_G00143310, partial [Pangasius djambal]|nr:hypothetical protein [Pangasius djambal]
LVLSCSRCEPPLERDTVHLPVSSACISAHQTLLALLHVLYELLHGPQAGLALRFGDVPEIIQELAVLLQHASTVRHRHSGPNRFRLCLHLHLPHVCCLHAYIHQHCGTHTC